MKKNGAIKCIFFGYPQGTKGYRLWVKEGRCSKTINSRNVVFNEIYFSCLSYSNRIAGSFSQTNNASSNAIQVNLQLG